MVGTDRALKNEQELRREAGPAFAEDQIIGVLNAQAGGATNQVEGIEQFLNVEKADIPGTLLGGESGFEGFRGALMASAGVMVNDGKFAPDLACLVWWQTNFLTGHLPLEPNSGGYTLELAIFDESHLFA